MLDEIHDTIILTDDEYITTYIRINLQLKGPCQKKQTAMMIRPIFMKYFEFLYLLFVTAHS
jgi:hypothetical protein